MDDVNLVNERVPSELIIDYPNSSYNEKNTPGDNTPPVKKPAPRAPPKSTNRQTVSFPALQNAIEINFLLYSSSTNN